MSNKFVLMDGNNLAHIAFHRGKSIILKNKKESSKDKKKEVKLTQQDFPQIKGMMYLVFFRKLHKYLKMFKDSYFVMAWDNPGSSEWRREIYPEYKASRDYTSDPIWNILFDGITELSEVLESYPIYQLKIEKLEADDILYVLSRVLKNQKVIIISGDSDMIQAAQEFKVKIYHPIKDKYIEIPKTYDYCVYKAIKGDKADEIEGIYGYGEVKATKLAEEIYGEDFIDDVSCPKLNKEQQMAVLRNLKLIRIANNPNLINLQISIEQLKSHSNVDLQKIQKFYFKHKLKSLIETFEGVVSIFN